MNPLITSADQLHWINLNKLPLNDRRRIEAVLPRRLWPAQVCAGSKWSTKPRPHSPAIDKAIAAALADYEADCE